MTGSTPAYTRTRHAPVDNHSKPPARSPTALSHAPRQGRAVDGHLQDSLVAVGKYLSTESALQVAGTAQKLIGDHGYFEHFEIDRYLRDFYGLVPIVGGQYAIETQLGERIVSDYRSRARRATTDGHLR